MYQFDRLIDSPNPAFSWPPGYRRSETLLAYLRAFRLASQCMSVSGSTSREVRVIIN